MGPLFLVSNAYIQMLPDRIALHPAQSCLSGYCCMQGSAPLLLKSPWLVTVQQRHQLTKWRMQAIAAEDVDMKPRIAKSGAIPPLVNMVKSGMLVLSSPKAVWFTWPGVAVWELPPLQHVNLQPLQISEGRHCCTAGNEHNYYHVSPCIVPSKSISCHQPWQGDQ